MAIDKSYMNIQLAYRAKFLQLQKQLEKDFTKIANEFDRRIQKLVDEYAKSDGTFNKKFLDDINREIDVIANWFTKQNATWIDRNLLQSAELAVNGREAAAGMYIKAAINQYKGDDRALLTKASTDPAAPFLLRAQFGTGLPEQIRKRIWARRWADGFTLSDRIWIQDKTLRQNLHGMIEQCVNGGMSAVDFSRAVQDYLKKPGPAWTTKIKPSVTGRGSIKYNALRLARTETNNAYRTTQALGAQKSSIVKGIKWNLSRSHPKEDICDTWATQDLYGLGPGAYPPDKLPPGHPNCLCFCTDVLLEGKELIKALKTKYQTPTSEAIKIIPKVDKEIAGTEYLGKIKDVKELGSGASETFIGVVNGKKYVFKADEPVFSLDMLSSNAEGEILASKIFNKFELPAPKVQYGIFDVGGERKRLMAFDFVEDGISVTKYLANFGYDNINLDQFRRMQVVDLLIGNGDRHNGNFFILPKNGSIVPIDHNMAFATNRIIDPDTTWQKCFLKDIESLDSHQTPRHILLRNTLGKMVYKNEGTRGYEHIIRQIQKELTDDEIRKLVGSLPTVAADEERKKELTEILMWRRNNLQELVGSVGVDVY
jgi:hypothetical protein